MNEPHNINLRPLLYSLRSFRSMVEVAGVEPASKDSLQSKSTCLVVLCSHIELQGNQKSFDASR